MDENERKVFWETLCSLDGKDLVADRTKLLATIKYPPLLYRYRPINQKSIDALQNNKLFFSSANHYDDPFDTYLRIDWNKVKSAIASIDLKSPGAFTQFKTLCESLNISTDLVESLREKFENLTMDDLLESFIQMIEKHIRPKIRRNSFSICFSENPCNENLWLKYADNHAGFCLIYNPYDNDAWLCGKQEKCKNCVVANASKSLYPVYYSKEKYDGTQYAIAQAWFMFMCEGLKNIELAQNFAQNVPMHWESEKVSLIKHKCHEYDEEWRILFGAAPNADACLRWIPHGVVLGLRTSVANIQYIQTQYQNRLDTGISTKKTGVVICLDVLGWKNYTRPNQIENLTTLTASLESEILQDTLRATDNKENNEIAIVNLSDTIFIFISDSSPYFFVNVFKALAKFVNNAFSYSYLGLPLVDNLLKHCVVTISSSKPIKFLSIFFSFRSFFI